MKLRRRSGIKVLEKELWWSGVGILLGNPETGFFEGVLEVEF